jgi:hypothetical protein
MLCFDVPIALFIYNRPVHLRATLARVREIQPATLFVVADGPKDPTDAEACRAARACVTTGADWPCDLRTLFRDQNLGTARSVSGGLDWIFSQVDRAIILEDDCVADPSFFAFCREMLERYAADERVMQVSGTNLAGRIAGPGSYGFTRFGLPCWGWATWARAWARYDFSLAGWDADREIVRHELGSSATFWVNLLDRYRYKLHSWDIQWNASIWKEGGRVVVPSVNLVGNTGYGTEHGEAATFTTAPSSCYANLPRGSCPLPLVDPVGAGDPIADATFDPFIQSVVIDFIEELGRFYRDYSVIPIPDAPGAALPSAWAHMSNARGGRLRSLLRMVSRRG